jgi:NitT/TauT family transport system permease protein
MRRLRMVNAASIVLGVGLWWILAMAGLRLPRPVEVVSAALAKLAPAV